MSLSIHPTMQQTLKRMSVVASEKFNRAVSVSELVTHALVVTYSPIRKEALAGFYDAYDEDDYWQGFDA